MKLLVLLTDGPDRECDEIVEAQARAHEVTVIDLSKRDAPYEQVIREIWAHDRVMAW